MGFSEASNRGSPGSGGMSLAQTHKLAHFKSQRYWARRWNGRRSTAQATSVDYMARRRWDYLSRTCWA